MLSASLISDVEALGNLQNDDGSITSSDHAAALKLLDSIIPAAHEAAGSVGQPAYAEGLCRDFDDWKAGGLDKQPDFTFSRNSIVAPENHEKFFFVGPLRLANGGRSGWRFETFLSLRNEPDSAEYEALYRKFPHPKNICQSSHLICGSTGLTNGNNIVFFPENIQSDDSDFKQTYAIFFFNKFYKIFNQITLPSVQARCPDVTIENPTGSDPGECYKARCVWGYLHDYFHHCGARPFDEQIKIKTLWFTGLLEEIKVDLESFCACLEGDIIHGRTVAEFIILDRMFRYPLEPDWNRNFDSGTGLFLLAYFMEENAMDVEEDGSVHFEYEGLIPACKKLIASISRLEQLEDDAYKHQAKEFVRRFLPDAERPARFTRSPALDRTFSLETINQAALAFSHSDLGLQTGVE